MTSAVGASTNARNPFYLHEDDHPCLILVSELLDENNYLTWRRSMERALKIKNKLGFINGEIDEPKAGDPNHERWDMVDATVLCWIFNSMSQKIAVSFVSSKNAKALWDGVYQIYGVAAEALRSLRIYRLNRELYSLTQGNDSVTTYFGKLQRIWGELALQSDVKPCECGGCTCGWFEANKSRLEEDKLYQFLNGLNRDFDEVRSLILIKEPLPSVLNAYSLVLFNEDRKKTRDNAAAKPSKYRMCEFCGRKGHIREKCYKLHGYPAKQEVGRTSNARYGYYAGPSV